ncbi:MAG: crossover junction endodeoxyribonuclease RuvC [Kiritimatiellia bacterium]
MKLTPSILRALQTGRDGVKPPARLRVLGIDASLRSTGLGIVESEAGALRMVDCRPVRNRPGAPLSQCLLNLAETLRNYIAEFQPGEAAMEGIFFCKNARTALLLGHARGVLLSVCAEAGIPVHEYPPTRIKQAVTGTGSATKAQIQHMMKRIFALPELPQEDAGDALAIAVTHLHTRNGVAVLAPKTL